MLRSVLLFGSILSCPLIFAELPDWYERDIAAHVRGAKAVVLYRIESVELVDRQHQYYIYRVNTTTIEVIKGAASPMACYLYQSEGPSDYASDIGNAKIVIQLIDYGSECGFIDSGFGAPGTQEYIHLFKSIVADDE